VRQTGAGVVTRGTGTGAPCWAPLCAHPISQEVALRSSYVFAVHDAPHRTRPAGLGLSLLLHVVVVLLLLIPLRRDFARVLSSGDPSRRGGGGGGGGAGRVAYITLPAPAASAPAAIAVTAPRETPPPVPILPPATPPAEIPPPAPAQETPAPAVQVAAVTPDSAGGGTGPGQGGGAGGGTGGGIGPGTGPGTGPGSGPGAGEGGSGRAPELRHMPIPPDNPPKELRGAQIRVTFWVDEVGKAVRVALDPPIRDRKYAEKFTETMLNYKFRPALGPDGRPVASTYTAVVSY
jgi:hypothetical protein